MNNAKRSPQRQREYTLYRYHKALERGDFETVFAILKEAENDPLLSQMISEMDSSLESEFEAEIRQADGQLISPIYSSNGQPPKLDLIQEKTTMTSQSAYWEPVKSTGRPNRLAAAMVVLIAALVVGGVFLFMVPWRTSIMTMVIQQPTQTPAEIAKLYVEEIWGKGNPKLAKTLIAADFVDHDPMFVNNSRLPSANDKNNSAVFNYNIDVLRTAFADLNVKIEDVIEGGDRVVVRWTFTGTHTQPFLTYAVTNKNVTMTNTDILRIVDGKISERWGENKLQSLLDSIEVVNLSPSAVEAVTAFARFAYLYSANKISDFGDALSDDIVLNGEVKGLDAVKAASISTANQSNGLTNLRMISALTNGNHLIGKVEFDTNNGSQHNRGTVKITIKDGKIVGYDYVDGW